MKIIVANLKMSLTKEEIIKYKDSIEKIKRFSNINLILCPTYLYIPLFTFNNYLIGSQDVSEYTNFKHTGEVSAKQLKSMNVSYSIIGHSEQLKQTYKTLVKKIKNLEQNKIIPILCIDKVGITFDNIISKIDKTSEIVIAYEPIKSIGTGKIENLNKLISQCKKIKGKLLKYNFNNFKIIYGGSVNKNNCESILKTNILDGLMIGEYSTDVDKFIGLLNKVEVLK